MYMAEDVTRSLDSVYWQISCTNISQTLAINSDGSRHIQVGFLGGRSTGTSPDSSGLATDWFKSDMTVR